MARVFFLALVLLGACKPVSSPGTGSQPAKSAGAQPPKGSEPLTPLPRCRTGEPERPNRDRPTKVVALSLSLEPFGPFPSHATGVASFASSPAPVSSQCRPVGTSAPQAPVGFYRGGGFVQTFCTYEIGEKHVTNDAELASALKPIDSPRKALAMVALSRVLAFEPDPSAKAPTKEVKMPTAVFEKGVKSAFELEVHDGGYVVRVPVEMNCPMMTVRTAFRVTTAGELCEADEPPVVLDVGSGICAD